MGIGFGIGTGFLVDKITRYLTLKTCTILGCIFVAIGTILTITAPHAIYVWLDVLIVAIAMALAYSTILTIFSNQVDADSQGWIMGITGAIMAFAFGINGLLVGLLADVSPRMPLMITVVSLLLAAVLMALFYKEVNLEKPLGEKA